MANTNPIQVQKFLTGMRFPASRDDIINCARSEGADGTVLDTLERIPSDRHYESPAEISREVSNVI